MAKHSVDYARVVSLLRGTPDPKLVGTALLEAVADRYRGLHQDCALLQFEQSGGHYLFDLASSKGLSHEDRTVAAWALTPPVVERRDAAYQRGFPLTPEDSNAPVDRGHLIPHLSGGAFGPNIFRQDRALNRGWSAEGRRYRALEREAAATPGTLYLGHLLYDDDTAYPIAVEIGLLRGHTLHAERFDNKPPRRPN
jgi:hypothetical protein